MPLSVSAAREPIHARKIECRGYRRHDGFWDIEGHLVDTKTYAFRNGHRGEVRPGEPVHEMWIRLTIDEDFKIHDVEAVTDAGPFGVCPDITPRFAILKGLSIGKGWRRAVVARLGGIHGCTHLVELLGPLATAAYQTLFPLREKREQANPQRVKPAFIDSCHALAADSEVVKQHWPAFYTGK